MSQLQRTSNAHTGVPFDLIRQVRLDGSEFWSARTLCNLVEYETWRNFAAAIERAKIAIQNTGEAVTSHVADASKLVERPQGGSIQREDYELSRFAAYLVLMNGDPRKPKIAEAQRYFAMRTRQAEVADTLDLSDPLAAIEAVREREGRAIEIAKSERAARVEAEARNRELEPAASAWRHLASSDGDYEVADAAKVLSRDPNINIGRDRLFSFMAAEGWIYRNRATGRWKVYQTQIDGGRLAEKFGRPFLHEPSGEMRLGEPTIRITPKGVRELHKRLGGYGQPAVMASSS